jgi:hypothetical protein
VHALLTAPNVKPRHIRVTFDLSGIGAANVICDGEASDPFCAWNRAHP